MSQLFDEISRLVASPSPRWNVLGQIISLFVGAAFASVVTNRFSRNREEKERPSSSRRRTANNTDLRRAYTNLAERERYASAMVVMLDEQFRAIQAVESTAEEQLDSLQDERKLLAAELLINEQLRTLYITAADDGQKRDNDPLLVRTALLHWMVLLRRRSMQGFHTLVEGLEDDPDCRGDIIADRLFDRYFNTLFEEGLSDREIYAGHGLTELARQSACLGAQQSAQLASDLYWSFVELRSFLRLNGLERLVPYVAQAAASPLLLFYDVEKYRGPQSPLARWFQENYEWLIQGVETKRIPIFWHGLWLYDRRTGRLFGYRPTAKPTDENDVQLALFFASIISRENLGRYDCTFAEMVERDPTSKGYLCMGSTCEESKQSDAQPGRLAHPRLLTRRKAPALGPLAKAGFSEDTATALSCNESSSNNGDKCGNGIAGLGRDWRANTVRCVSQQVMQPGEKLIRCVAEATGRCSNPLDKAAKELQEAMFAGVKIGKNCQLTQNGGDQKKEEERKKAEAEQKVKEAKEKEERAKAEAAAKEKAKLEAEEKAKEAETNLQELKLTRESLVAANTFIGSLGTKVIASVNYLILGRMIGFAEEAVKVTKDELEKAKSEAEKAAGAYKSASDDFDNANQEWANLFLRRYREEDCPPDTPGCGGNDCTAMDDATRKLMQCFEEATTEEDRYMLRRKPGVIDPAEPDIPLSPAMECFKAFDQVSEVNKECWAWDCGPELATVWTVQEKCDCQREGQPVNALRGACFNIRCEEGLTPTIKNGICVCDSGPGGPFGGEGPMPVGPFTTSAPRLFSEVRFESTRGEGNRDTGGRPPFRL